MNVSFAAKLASPAAAIRADDSSERSCAMMDAGRSAILALLRHGEIDEGAVRKLRAIGIGEGSLSREEADALFALERAQMPKPAAWDEFFVNAITDYCVWDLRPTGVVNEAQGEWLIETADRAATRNAFAVLVNVVDVAHRVPMWFTAAVKARAAHGWPGQARA